jgi:pyruvate kinase
MNTFVNRLNALEIQFEKIINQLYEFEKKYEIEISLVSPIYKKSALNLIHYLAFRSFDIATLQNELRDLSLPSLSNIEPHVMKSLIEIKNIISSLNGNPIKVKRKGIVSIKKSKKILNRNTKILFGYKSKKRRTRIMVTLPNTAAEDYGFVNGLMQQGMNSARINCAHDNTEVWKKMIENIKESNKSLKKSCKVMMDLGGPKLRTGQMVPGAEVIHIKPKRDEYGKITESAKVWIAPPDILPPDDSANAILPVDFNWFKKIKKGNIISFTDTRDKKCKIIVDKKKGEGKWGICNDSAYVKTGTELTLHKQKNGTEKIRVGELLPLEQFILLKVGDKLILTKDESPGESSKYDDSGRLVAVAHVSCTLPDIFLDLKPGEPIFFDDGKIEGIIETVSNEQIEIKITYAKDLGSKLKADKGINLPISDIKTSGLTVKDKQDLVFVTKQADVVNFSFVNDENDVDQLHNELAKNESEIGVILKIETQKGFNNLPRILLRAMRMHPVGVMIARGDLAIETGWKNFASIQEEILRICEAAHIPDVWATQVLETLAKKGVPTRAEITDSAMAQRAECVMLNKGHYINKAVKMLDKILRRMQHFQKKKETVLPKLIGAEDLKLSHDLYNF